MNNGAKKKAGGQPKPTEDHRKMISIRLSPDAFRILGELGSMLGIRATTTIEFAIRQLLKHYQDQADMTPSRAVRVMRSECSVTCPFCLEDDFDQVGLKIHLANGWCEAYVAVTA
ncbi:MAG: hypothetical protein Q8R07_04955 [Candidatus Uhrbacteria bacterium]|nr:hypothetical protein [Candidatus Uhrbacteria bacterium]